MTAADVVSGVLARVRNPGEVNKNGLLHELNLVQSEYYSLAKMARETWLETMEFSNIVGGQDVVDFPLNCPDGGMLAIERLDLADIVGDRPSRELSPAAPYEYERMATENAMVPDSIVVLAGRRIRLLPVPTASLENGLRWRYMRLPTAIRSWDQVPDVPVEHHEWLVASLLGRVLQFDGVELAKPAESTAWINSQQERLTQELRPRQIGQPPTIIDEDA